MYRFHKSIVLLIVLVGSAYVGVSSQTPFTTDDAEVTDKGKLHFEMLNEYDLLQRSLSPSLRQNTALARLAYGIHKNIEIGLDVPIVTIFNAKGTSPQRPFGLSDTSLHIKIKFHEEKKSSRLPALAAAFYVRLPTGKTSASLGSGVTNYFLYGVAQKSITEKTKIRVNTGILFAGNTVLGALGIRTASGKLFLGGISVVKQYTEKLKLGAEIFTVVSNNFQLSKGQLQTTYGGNYNLKKNFAIDFGFIVGRFPSSPCAGGLLGFTVDF